MFQSVLVGLICQTTIGTRKHRYSLLYPGNQFTTIPMKIPFVVTLVVVIFNVHQLQAQFSFHEETVFENNDRHYFGFAFAELNKDGKKDLILHEGGYSGQIICYRSNILDNSWTKDTIADKSPDGRGFSAGSFAAGDIDNDGDVDVIACEHIGEWTQNFTGDTTRTKIYWYENVDKKDQWKPHFIGMAPDYIKDIKLANFNKDKFVDLVFITNNDEHNLSVFIQPKKDHWERILNISLKNLHEGLDVGDIDGDGMMDIATNGYWIRNAKDSFEVKTIDEKWHNQTGDWRRNATKIVCRDIDHDKRAEVFIAHSERAGFPVSWYDYDAENDKWEEHVIYEGLSAVHTLQVGDIDRDGDFDVLAGENGDHNAPGDDDKRQVYIFLNEGKNQKWTKYSFSEAGLYNGLLVDVNSDGKLDIAGPHGHNCATFKIWYTFVE